MSDILNIFSGNPLSTFIGRKIEAATRPELETDDWALNLEICDIINENDDDAKDAIRAIRKRLQQVEQDKNFSITNKTLTVLETCVNNCTIRFHNLVMTKDFIQDLVKLIGPKNNPPIELQERVLRLIERWADAFKSQPSLNGVVSVYNELKSKGVTFPPPDPDSSAPILTPPSSAAPTARPVRQEQQNRQSQAQPVPSPSRPIILEGEGYNKISQDLGVVQTSIDMFNEIMRILEANNEESDWQLATDLNTTCRQMRDRIVDLIERVANEDLTIELLRLNDDLNNVFTKYDRLVKNRGKTPIKNSDASESTKDATRPGGSGISPQTANELSLIDFNAEDSSDRDQETQQKPKPTDANVDPFDTSRILSKVGQRPVDQGRPSKSLAEELGHLELGEAGKSESKDKKSSGLPEEISSVREQDFAEIENWLSTGSGRGDDLPSVEPISIPNSEFENFIATRALVGSSRPTDQSGSSSQTKKLEPST